MTELGIIDFYEAGFLFYTGYIMGVMDSKGHTQLKHFFIAVAVGLLWPITCLYEWAKNTRESDHDMPR